jgi:hypothetical protein
VTLGTPLAAGASIQLQFLMGNSTDGNLQVLHHRRGAAVTLDLTQTKKRGAPKASRFFSFPQL